MAKRAATKASKRDDKPTKKAYPMVSRKNLNSLLEQCLIYDNRAATASGHAGDLIREAVQKRNLHGGAFGIIKRLHRMGSKDPGKLWLLLAHFDDMREKSGLDRIAKEQGQLLPAISEDDRGLEPEPENVVNYPREVEEQAGEEHAA